MLGMLGEAVFNANLCLGQVLVVRADHPFLFLIRDTASGAIVFMGRVADAGTLQGAAS